MAKVEGVPGKWQCMDCGFVAKSTNLYYHIESKHVSVSSYACDHCGKVYKTRDSFKKHVAVHKRNPGFFGRGAYNSSKGEEREIVTGPGDDFEDGQESYENTDN